MVTKTRRGARRKATLSTIASRDAILDERARRLATRDRTAPDQRLGHTALVCEVGEGLYALPLTAVSRAVPLVRLGAAPSTDPTLVGLAADSGAVLQVFDLAALLGAAPASRAASGYLLILRRGQTALRIDNRPVAALIEPIEGPEPDRARVIDPASPLNGRTLVTLSPDALFSLSPRPQPEPVFL
jgi:chemotaxis signal transduction protein